MNLTLAPRPKVGLSTKLFYGLGSVAYGVKDNGFSAFLLLFYNQVLGLPAPWVGAAIGIALVVDSVLDPVIGQISDNWRSRWGRRHPCRRWTRSRRWVTARRSAAGTGAARRVGATPPAM